MGTQLGIDLHAEKILHCIAAQLLLVIAQITEFDQRCSADWQQHDDLF